MKVELDFDLEQIAARAAAIALEQLTASPAATDGHDDLRLLSADEVADLVGRSARGVRERKLRGDLPYVRLDAGAAMYRRVDVDAFILARRIGS